MLLIIIHHHQSAMTQVTSLTKNLQNVLNLALTVTNLRPRLQILYIGLHV